MPLCFSDKFLAFSGPHNKTRIENGKCFSHYFEQICVGEKAWTLVVKM